MARVFCSCFADWHVVYIAVSVATIYCKFFCFEAGSSKGARVNEVKYKAVRWS